MVQEATVHPGQDDEHLTDHPEFQQFRANVPHNMTTVPLNITQPEQGKATMNIGHSVLDVLRLAQELGVPMDEAFKALENQKRSEHLFNQMVYSPEEQQLPEDMKPTFAGTKFNKPDEGIFHQGNPMDMSWRLLKMTPEEMRALLAQQQAEREQKQREQEQHVEQEYEPHFEELRRLVAEKRAEADALEAQLRAEQAKRGQQ